MITIPNINTKAEISPMMAAVIIIIVAVIAIVIVMYPYLAKHGARSAMPPTEAQKREAGQIVPGLNAPPPGSPASAPAQGAPAAPAPGGR